MPAQRATGLILKSYDYGELDRLHVILTPQLGKVIARAWSDRRTNKLQAGHLQPFLLTDLLLSEGHGGWQIKDAQTSQQYGHIAGSLLARLHVIAEVIDRFALPEEPDAWLWSAGLVANQLVVGDQLSQLGLVEVLAKVAMAVGLTPDLTRCVISGAAVKEAARLGWSSLHGGLVMLDEAGAEGEACYIVKSPQTIKLLRLAGSEARVTGRLKVPDSIVAEAEWLMLDYFQVQLSKNLRALPFLTLTDAPTAGNM